MIAARRAKALAISATSGARRCMRDPPCGTVSQRRNPFSVRGCKRTTRASSRVSGAAHETSVPASARGRAAAPPESRALSPSQGCEGQQPVQHPRRDHAEQDTRSHLARRPSDPACAARGRAAPGAASHQCSPLHSAHRDPHSKGSKSSL